VAIHDSEAVPVVSITPVNPTSQPDATPADASAYANWEDSSNPIVIPVEGEGARVELHLHAALDQIYADASDMQACLEPAAGLDFWTSSTGGSAMTAAEFSANEIKAGDYDGDVWVSQDPAYAGWATPTITLDYQGTIGDPVTMNVQATAPTAAPTWVTANNGVSFQPAEGSVLAGVLNWAGEWGQPIHTTDGAFLFARNSITSRVCVWGDFACNSIAGSWCGNSGSVRVWVENCVPGVTYRVNLSYAICLWAGPAVGDQATAKLVYGNGKDVFPRMFASGMKNGTPCVSLASACSYEFTATKAGGNVAFTYFTTLGTKPGSSGESSQSANLVVVSIQRLE
jgi:hypothetical protein